jgi:paraquat-inducible protein A
MSKRYFRDAFSALRMNAASFEVVTCGTCGLLQRMPQPKSGARTTCARCHFELHRRKPDSQSRTFALALGALVLYFPANLLPIVQTDYWGMHEKTTIFDGIHGLFETGSYFVGCLVFTTSILTPALKILGLLTLSLTQNRAGWEQFRTWVYKIIQIVDPWNMLEVTMLAILVALAEMGKIATVHPGAGVFSFAGVVVLTICATLTFDPRLIWDNGKKNHE